MDKKVGVSILFGFLLIVGFIGLTIATNDSGVSTNMLGQANITLDGDDITNDSYTVGGSAETANVTIRYGLTSGLMNITNITITLDANFTFNGWVEYNNDFAEACFGDPRTEAAANCQGANVTYTNVTIMNGNPALWSCLNTSATVLNCYNTSAEENTDLGPDNSTITIRFRVRAISGFEDVANWIINVTDQPDHGAGDSNTTTLNTYIDGLAPRITDINVTDGNITLINGTNPFASITNLSKLSDDADNIYVFATVTDLNLHTNGTLYLVFNESIIGIENNLTSIQGAGVGGSSANGSTAPISAQAGVKLGTVLSKWDNVKGGAGSGQSLSALVRWTLSKSDLANQNITQFQFLVNDSFDQGAELSDLDNGADDDTFKFQINSTIVKVGVVNISDGTNSLSGSGINDNYIVPRRINFTFEFTGDNKTNVTLIYNETAGFDADRFSGDNVPPFENGKILGVDNNVTDDTTNTGLASMVILLSGADTPNTGVALYEASIQFTQSNSTQNLSFAILANATFDGSDGGAPITENQGNYTIVAGPYNVRLDGDGPNTPTITEPTTNSVDVKDTLGLTYKCSANDALSGVKEYEWKIVKPGNTVTDLKTDKDGIDIVVKGDDLDKVGTNEFQCRAVDNLGNTGNYKSVTFTVHEINTAGAGGGAGGGAGAAVSFDVDFTASPQATFKASQGRVKSFSFDGATKHTITFNEVTANSVTLIIASDPITVLLNTGQSKSVDVNADGADDMKVQLNGVDNGVADVTVTKLEEGAAKIKAEEEQAREEVPSEEREATPVAAGRSLAWLWWTLIVIVAIVAIGYYVNKRK